MRAELISDCANRLGEGIIWDAAAGLVRWADIHGRALWSHDPSTGRTSHRPAPGRLTAFAPRARGPGLLAAFADRIALWDPETGAETPVAPYGAGRPGLRLNDGKTDRQGRFIVGGMDEAAHAPEAHLLRVGADLRVETLFGGVRIANGTCFAPDGRTLYFADTPTRLLRAFPYEPADGSLGTPRTLADFAPGPGWPDGACVDAEGGIWVAEWDGARVVRLDPEGRIERTVALPVPKVTCCAFGGPDLATLYITTARQGSEADAPDPTPRAGGLFAVRPGVRGLPDAPFAG
jgi:L-arabinonolactonase